MRKIIYAILVLFAVVFYAQSYEKLGCQWRPSALPIQYYINTTNAPSGAVDAICASFNTWQSACYSWFRASYAGTTSLVDNNDGYNVFLWGTTWSSTAIAETFYYTDGEGHLIETDVIFNDSLNFSTTTPPQPNCFDVQNIATHEIGHIVGLDDLNNYNDMDKTMFGYSSVEETKKRTLEQDDVDGAIDIYHIIHIPSDETTIYLAGNYAISGQIIIPTSSRVEYNNINTPSGVTLQLNSGISVAFNGSLYVNGYLTASSATLTFTSSTGLIVNGSANCTGTTFTGSSWNGITLNTTSVSFSSNNVTNAETGITFNNGYAGNFQYNRICSNTYGIKYTGNSYGNYFPNNKISDNNMNITISSGSTPEFGRYSGQGNISIYGSRQYDISSAYAGTIFACYNWWGQYPADPVRYGTIDFSNELNYDPNPKINNIAENTEPAQLFLKTGNKKTSDATGIKEFDIARGLFSQKKYSEAESALREVINKYPDKLSGRIALITLNQCLKDDKKDAERDNLLYDIKNNKRDINLISISGHIKAKDLKENGKPELAASELEEIINTNSNFENMPFVLYDLATIKYFTLNDKTAGEKYYNTLIEKYPDEEITKSALVMLGKTKPNVNPKEITEKKIIIEKTTLLANYPNPFNPTTVIKYNLAENTDVTLKVYDVLGREVKTLLNEFKPIGSYEVKFDGNGLSSGLYFYQLKAGKVNQIMKMVLTK